MGRSAFMVAFLAGVSLSAPALAWEGFDAESGATVEIERGNLVREGRSIEFYDHDKGEYREFEIDQMYRSGGSVTIEGVDVESGETRTLEMDDNN